VIVFGTSPDLTHPNQVLKYIAGLAKFILSNHEGQASLTELAAACAMDRETVRTALLYWESKGAFAVNRDDDSIQISAQKTEGDPEAAKIYLEVFQNLMGEINAYRKFFLSAGIENLFPLR
jgi:hypothetical protein